MTPEQVQIVKLTFAQVMIDKDQVGRIDGRLVDAVAGDDHAEGGGGFSIEDRERRGLLSLGALDVPLGPLLRRAGLALGSYWRH